MSVTHVKMDDIRDPEKLNYGFLRERGVVPVDPPDGEAVLWFSNGVGDTNDGDLVMTKTVGGVTTTIAIGTASASAANAAELLVLDGANLADVADDQLIGGGLIVFPIAIAGGVTANSDVTISQKIRVIDFWAQMNGAGDTSDTLQLKSTAAAISDALDWTGSDKAIVRAGTLDNANTTVASGGILRVTMTDNAGDNGAAGVAYVLAIPSA